jgi:hypothetical protein
MTIRKTVTLIEEINSEYGARASPPLRRVAIAAVLENPLAGKAAGADLKPLIDYSLELGASLTKAALAMLGATTGTQSLMKLMPQPFYHYQA